MNWIEREARLLPPELLGGAVLLLGALMLIFIVVALCRSGVRGSARWRRKHANVIIERLAGIPDSGQQFAYLRKVDPFTFLFTPSQRNYHGPQSAAKRRLRPR